MGKTLQDIKVLSYFKHVSLCTSFHTWNTRMQCNTVSLRTEEDKTFYCEICNVGSNSAINHRIHLEGKRHIKSLMVQGLALSYFIQKKTDMVYTMHFTVYLYIN